MKKMRAPFALGLAIGLMMVTAAMWMPAAASAQTAERVWDQGTVWQITHVETKPNMFNSYVKNLSQVWRAFLDEQMKSGDVVSYKMLNVQNPRDGEPDLMLLVEYKNMAVFDQSIDEFEAMAAKIMGSLDDMQTDNVAREDMRTIRSTVLRREITFKDMGGE